MLFTGEHERAIDAKQRLSIPSEIRLRLCSGPQSHAVYAMPRHDASIWLWPEETFERIASNLDQSLLPDESSLEYEQVLFSQSRRLEIDKAGRIRVPESLLALAGISDHAVILGVRDHLEVRDPATWAKVRDARLSELGDVMLRARAQQADGHST